MKTIIYIAFFYTVLCSINAKGQQNRIESLLNQHQISCYDIAFNSQKLIPEYYKKGKTDTVSTIMKYWEENCGLDEELFRLKVLLAIKADTFSENMYHNLPLIHYILHYKNRGQYYVKLQNNSYYDKGINNDTQYDNFTRNLAVELSNKPEKKSLEIFFLDLYSNRHPKHIFNELKNNNQYFQNTQLKLQYDSSVKYYSKLLTFHYSFLGGLWIPSKNLATLGNHPLVGFQMGVGKGKFAYDLTMELRFLNSANPYWVENEKVLYHTQHYFGVFAGLDAAYNLLTFNRNQLFVSGGIAYEGFDAVKKPAKIGTPETYKTLGAFNINPGLSYRWSFENKSYLGLDFRYNIAHYNNKNGTDLSGNSITIRLKYGLVGNKFRDYNLETLEFLK